MFLLNGTIATYAPIHITEPFSARPVRYCVLICCRKCRKEYTGLNRSFSWVFLFRKCNLWNFWTYTSKSIKVLIGWPNSASMIIFAWWDYNCILNVIIQTWTRYSWRWRPVDTKVADLITSERSQTIGSGRS